ncbi:GNAT family N-acetyltransferase [Chamaesiphon sp.]|uniref:GNAT family N-acetyltransferase n=1 Tax=Chamaesiphon sp. TaxID=2814140 RepID=UPI00359481AA
MYTLNRLEQAFEALAYQAFTFPRFRPLLQALKPQSSIVAIAASDANQPIGLALAQIQPDRQSCKVLSIFVKPNYRQQGIGTALLQRLEAELHQCQCDRAELTYTTGNPTTSSLERLLQKRDWSDPKPRMLVGKTTTDTISDAPWMKRISLPVAYSLFPWQEITPTDRIALQQQKSPWIPPMLLPFLHEENIEPLNSLGLRYQGEVVGWLITHRLDPATVRYTCGFIRPDLKLRYISLLANAIQIQIDAKIPFGIWTIPLEFSSMAHFVKARMAPYLISLEESKVAYKSLKPYKTTTERLNAREYSLN